MKKLLIIYPNWVPSNAVGVQRVRLIVNYLNDFGWQPIILTVKSKYYEEEISLDLLKIVSPGIQVEYVDAKKAGKYIRLYGDIALRAFWNLKRKAVEIIKKEKIDFIWVPIPPFYTALIARLVNRSTGTPYGIDYIDPWVHNFPGSNKILSRHWFSTKLAKLLEPIAIKNVSFFTGVSEAYFLPVLKRNPRLKNISYCGMPYGFDPGDYKVKPENLKLLWNGETNILPYLYAGAFLPKSHYFIDELFRTIALMRKQDKLDKRIRFYFVGTGSSVLNSISDYAIKHDIINIVIEKKERISYLEILNNLSNAYGILAIGSTEPHYTASKIFQVILSKRPVFAIFHKLSTAIKILENANADTYLIRYNEFQSTTSFEEIILQNLESFMKLKRGWNPDLKNIEQYSAKHSARALAGLLDSKVSSK